LSDEKVDFDTWIKEKWGVSKLPKGGVVPQNTSLAYKTGDWRVYIPVLHDGQCTGCTKCYFVCPDDAIAMDDRFHPIFKFDYCKGCTLCADICPTTPKAIEMILEEK
jgi:pyruvate ferredoxin oxidoreductase delta subunit